MRSRDVSRSDRHEPLQICVLGLWHLGSVTAACLAECGFDVVGVDPDREVVSEIDSGRPPVAEPGLADVIGEGLRSGKLTFESLDGAALSDADVIWIAFDTPVDDDDRADSEWVIDQARQALLRAGREAHVVVSSQLPVGSTARLAARLGADGRDDLRFACVPENLRLGNALESFRSPDRYVAGVNDAADRHWLAPLLTPFTEQIEWMRVESAEMTKHALNGFLATSVAYINEIASICESVDADASEVSRGLKSDRRIGPRSYLSPGDVFAGGTLARDLSTLSQLANDHELPAHLMAGVAASNRSHREWARRAIAAFLAGDGSNGNGGLLAGKRTAVWGLTYKPGTDTLRRSSALELCHWLHEQGAVVRAHDPAISALPQTHASRIELCKSPLSAACEADAVVVCTPWPAYRDVHPEDLIATMQTPVIIDAGGHLHGTMSSQPAIRYARVGARPR